MHEKVQAYINASKETEKRQYEREKKETLIKLGLYEKEYSPNNIWSSEYSFPQWDEKSMTTKYYKRVPCEVTDEEYQEIKKCSKDNKIREEKTDLDESQNNKIAIALTVIAWIIFIGGFIAGIALGTTEVQEGTYYTYSDTEFSFAVAFIYWCVSFISGTMFLGFAEIIKLLEAINNKE